MKLRWKRKNILAFISILLIIGFSNSCKNNPYLIDVSHISLELDWNRFEIELFELNEANFDLENIMISKKYGDFFNLFSRNIINIGDTSDPAFKLHLLAFINDPSINEVYELTSEKYNDISDIETSLEQGFKHYLYYFPDKPVPKIATCISGFNYAIITTDSILGIGLDMYLGSNSNFYKLLSLPQYKTLNMSREFIVADAMKGWLTSDYILDETKSNLLTQMIYHGKVLFALDLMFPEMEDRLKIGYTSEQVQWCKNNEGEMWAFYVDKEILFSSSHMEIIKYIGEGPFTSGFPENSPGRTGWWLGWQIVKSYMRSHDNVTLEQLFLEENAQKILTQSKYKPKK